MSHAVVLVAVEPGEKDIEKAVAEQMAPFDENGTFFKNGSRWDWYQIGGRFSGRLLGNDTCKVKDLDPKKLEDFRRKSAIASWDAAVKFKKEHGDLVEMMYGFDPGKTTREEFIEKQVSNKLAFPAFLRRKKWHEGERMGWWGMKMPTECEIKKGKKGEKATSRCIAEAKNGAKIFNYNEDEETWRSRYFSRFIEGMNPEATLVVVDYHV